MGVRDVANGSEVVHGFPHLDTVRSAVTALYRRLSPEGVRSYAPSVLPADVAFADQDDLHLGAQRVARALVQHLHLPDARIVVSFREMQHAASVELTAGPEYFIELNDRFRTHRRDIGAALAHEITHVLLHRLGLATAISPGSFPPSRPLKDPMEPRNVVGPRPRFKAPDGRVKADESDGVVALIQGETHS